MKLKFSELMPENILPGTVGPSSESGIIYTAFLHSFSLKGSFYLLSISTRIAGFTISCTENSPQMTPKVGIKYCQKCPGIHIPPLLKEGESLLAFNEMQ